MDAVNKIGKITIDVKDVLIDSVMNICLRKTDYTYTLEKNVVVIAEDSRLSYYLIVRRGFEYKQKIIPRTVWTAYIKRPVMAVV